MKRCPKCLDVPDWHFCSNTTRKRADGEHYFNFIGCHHANELAKGWGIVPRAQCAELAAKWNAEAERLLALVTERWTEPQRTAFALKLGHVSHEPELAIEEESEAPAAPTTANGEGEF